MFKFIILLAALVSFGCSDQSQESTNSNLVDKLTDQNEAAYVGVEQCIACHESEYKHWQGSHHDLAMQEANEQTVLGDFNNTTFNYFGTASEFYKKDETFYVKTDGPDGKLTEYPVAYVFGVYPLQQYLIKFPQGKYQTLSISWDARSKEEGGQRWFHLYPDEHIKHNDELHWTGINQNWNFMCADCHSTNLHKNYDVDKKEYNTKWSEIDVACEACHGPGSKHIDWADTKNNDISHKGLMVEYNERTNIHWSINTETGNAQRSQQKKTNIEIETCAQCHSRRSTIAHGARPGDALLDNFKLSLLTEQLYHPDGQIKGEVYVYGSFIQSKMYHAGVTCSDCHEPHSLKLRVEGNALCAQCHSPAKYNSEQHTLHKADTEGAQCVSCHMPETTYMVVDPRRDHSMRIPRPDLSDSMSTPNACNNCHADKASQWAADVLAKKFAKPGTHYAEALHAGRLGSADAGKQLSDLISDKSQPAIVRATAASLLPANLSNDSAKILQAAANDEQPIVTFGVANALNYIPRQYRLPFASPLMYDDMRSTRVLAASSLAGVPLQDQGVQVAAKYNEVINEYINSELFNADRPEPLVNLGNFYALTGNTDKARMYYQQSINVAPYYAPAYMYLADLYRALNEDDKGVEILQQALFSVRDSASIQHALGLVFVRQKKLTQAVNYLRMAAEASVNNERYIYVYAIALHSTGEAKKAIEVLEQALEKFPQSVDVLNALVSINKELGNSSAALKYEEVLQGKVN